ncbi:MAG: substrate-binding domain-containing protein [Armatimonadetes bacterium]|nr:substrate-binding domain-containing protein [Armatimonadota bacterium]
MKSLLSVAAAGALVLAGCTGDDKVAEGGGGEKLQIAVIPKGTNHEFWKSVHAGAQAAANEFGVEIIWKGPLKEDDLEDQVKVVEDFVTRKVDGICLAPLDNTAMRMPVTSAQKSGVPVLIFDSGLNEVETVSFVATDNRAGGRKAGERIVQLLGGKGKVIMLRYAEGSASTHEREEGFLEAVKAAPGIQIISDNQYGGATTESATKASENLLARFKNPDGVLQFQGVYCPNESTTFGMLRALQDAGFAGKVKFVGFDSSEKLVDGLKSGQIDALILQNPYKMGYEAVKTMVAHIKGETVEKRIDTGAAVVDKANMEEPDMAKLIAPPKI